MKKIYLFLLFPAVVMANGSSGVGSVRVPVAEGIELQMDGAKFKAMDHRIFDAQGTREVLMLQDLSAREFSEQVKRYNSAKLGAVDAWEFLPDREQEKRELNSWIICGANKSCTKIVAAKSAGQDAGILIGSLIGEEKDIVTK